jgi:hypothetical protein
LHTKNDNQVAAPVVFVFHGGFGIGAQAESNYGMSKLAETNNFIAVYPDGRSNAWNSVVASFESVAEAAKALNIFGSGISATCTGVNMLYCNQRLQSHLIFGKHVHVNICLHRCITFQAHNPPICCRYPSTEYRTHFDSVQANVV